MGWLSKVAVLVVLRFISLSSGVPVQAGAYLEENVAAPRASEIDSSNSNIASPLENNANAGELEEEAKLQQVTNYLTYVLLRPWPGTGLPLLYVEDYPVDGEYQEQANDLSEFNENLDADNQVMEQVPYKRSRYYRKYPWKRQNSREAYEAENRYLCQPSKDDVFRLLVALHEARQGNRGHTIHFCNRKRPASAIFTNIRFLGKRK